VQDASHRRTGAYLAGIESRKPWSRARATKGCLSLRVEDRRQGLRFAKTRDALHRTATAQNAALDGGLSGNRVNGVKRALRASLRRAAIDVAENLYEAVANEAVSSLAN
jgi:hypothetical protein